MFYFEGPLGQLHGEAVDAAVLAGDGQRIYTDHFAVGEGELNLASCLLVLFRLVVRRINHRLVQNQEVGIGGRQAVALALRVCSHGGRPRHRWRPASAASAGGKGIPPR